MLQYTPERIESIISCITIISALMKRQLTTKKVMQNACYAFSLTESSPTTRQQGLSYHPLCNIPSVCPVCPLAHTYKAHKKRAARKS